MKIRLLERKDIPHATAIIAVNYSDRYAQKSMVELECMFGSGPVLPQYYVMEDEERIVGLAGFTQSWMDYNVYEIFWVNVMPEYQRRGIGKQLVQKALDEIRTRANDCLVLLTTDSPTYYSRHFNFKIQTFFKSGTYQLMSLSIE